MDELEMLKKSKEMAESVIVGAQLVCLGLWLLELGYQAGVKRGWTDAANVDKGCDECPTDSLSPQQSL